MDNYLYQFLLAEIQKCFDKKSTMVNTLANILRIEKGAVYRRLRREVPFTFNEIVVIAKRLKISLDDMIGIDVQKSLPFQLRLPDFVTPKDKDLFILNYYLEFLQSINQSDDSEIASVTNMLPYDFFDQLHYLIRYYLFLWNFHYNNEHVKPYQQISIVPGINTFLKEFKIELRKFKKTNYIFDSKMFQLLVNNIKYFNSIRLIEKEDVLNIKHDLLSLLDNLEELAYTGQFKETGNSINIFISNIDIASNYTYMCAEKVYFSMIKTFLLTSVSSLDATTFQKIKKWIHSMIKISTLITLTNEKQRVRYFEKQRSIINEL